MNHRISSLAAATGVLAGAALLMLLTGCETDGSAQVTLYGDRPHGYGTATVMFEDDYDYYPGYEVYYSRNRREYVYRDGNSWVRRSQPRGITVNALLSLPSVRVDFRDSPERHHESVVRSYPRNWRRPDAKVVTVRPEPRQDNNRQVNRQDDRRDDKKVEKNNEKADKRNSKKNKKDRKDDDQDDRKDDHR